MARGNGSGDSDLNLYLMKIAGLKEGEKIHIRQFVPTDEKKNGKAVYKELEPIKNVSGDITRAKVRKYEYQGEDKYEFQVYLKDAEAKELCVLSCNMNSIGRSIINTLLNLDGPKGGRLEVSVWNKKDTGRASVFLKYDGNKVGWKYDMDEQNKYITENKVREKGKEVIRKDYFDLDMFLLKEFQDKFVSQYVTPEQFADKPATGGNDEGPDAAGSDDLPF